MAEPDFYAEPARLPRVLAALAAAVFAGAGVFVAAHHPLSPVVVLALFVGWALAASRLAWLPLFAVPALLPVVDLAPWTGWIAVEEFDLLVLGALAGGYAHLVASPSRADASARAGFALAGSSWVALFLVSQVVALYRGVLDAGGWSFDWTQGYDGPLNSVRIAKSFLFAVFFYPILRARWREDSEAAQRVLVAGLVAGLVAASLAVAWERLAFTGLLNFSTDYRTTALFWEMHVGGAALDGFLALTLPFVIYGAYRARSRALRALCLGTAALAAYAALTTFSRGVYVATVVSLALSYWLVQRQRAPDARRAGRRVLWMSTIVALVSALGAYYVFRHGGYRALAAMAAVAVLTFPVAHVARGSGLATAAVALGIGVGGLGWLLSGFLPKGPYVVFALFALATTVATFAALAGKGRNARLASVAGYVAMLLSAIVVARHWGGAEAFADAGTVGAVLFAIWVVAVSRRTPGIPDTPTTWKQAGIATLAAAGIVAVFSGGAYMSERFSTAEQDLADRLHHWRTGLALLRTPGDWALGRGLGRYPAAYLFGSPEGVIPGGYRVASDGDRHRLVLSSPSYPISFGDAFRVSQRVSPAADVYTVRARVRVKHPAHLHFEICEKHLLYSGECAIMQRTVEPEGERWQDVALTLDATKLSRGRWFAPNLAAFSITVETSSRAVEIGRVSLTRRDGTEVLANGDFSQGMAHWFFTSDRYHLPWHFKSLLGNVLFEQGWLGLAAFLVLIAFALGRLALGRASAHPLAPFLAAALAGFLVVGGFDSLLDAPRVAFLFYVLLLVALSIRGWLAEAG
ncbi:MAG: hypothetical protein IT518_28230 [Burkholderiales bacterium]|nr:hypothetical protein [Burkholderiales bacterium]